MPRPLEALKSVALFALLATPALVFADAPNQSAMPPLAATPSEANNVRIVSIQEVVLDTSYATDFRSEHPQVTAGWLTVITVSDPNKSVLAPRALAEPLLVASGTSNANGAVWTESVEWFNHGFVSGHRVCFIPSPVNEKGALTHVLAGVRVWFGTPRLPESVDGAALEQERALADGANIPPTVVGKVSAALHLTNRDALIKSARQLIARFAPDEVQADGTAAAPVEPAAPAVK